MIDVHHGRRRPNTDPGHRPPLSPNPLGKVHHGVAFDAGDSGDGIAANAGVTVPSMGQQTGKSNGRVARQALHDPKSDRRVRVHTRSTVTAIDLEPDHGRLVGEGGVFNGIDGLRGVHEKVHGEVQGFPGFARLQWNRQGDVGEPRIAEVARFGEGRDRDPPKLSGHLQPSNLPHFVGLHMRAKVHSERCGTAGHVRAVLLQSL